MKDRSDQATDALPRLGSGGTTISDIHSNYQNLPSRIELDLAGSDNMGVIEYRYDTEGRQISRWSWELDAVTGEKVAGTEGNEWSYYDALGRLDARVGLAGGVLDHRLVNLLQVGRRPEGEVGQWVRREFMASDADPDDPLLPGHLTRHWSTYGTRGLLAQTHAPITGAATHEKDVVEAEVVLNDHLGSPRLRLGSSRQVEVGGVDRDLELLGITTSWMPKNPMDYTPFGRELALSSDSKTTPDGYTGKPLDTTFGLQAMNYGARFYDPRLGRWWQRDPMDEFSTPYTYCGNMVMVRIDPTGRSTEINGAGRVKAVTDDGDLGVYVQGKSRTFIGTTKFWNEFVDPENPVKNGKPNAKGVIEVGETWDDVISEMNKLANFTTIVGVAFGSRNNGWFDIKSKTEIAKHGSMTGRLLNGQYATARSAGNFLAGLNARTAPKLGFDFGLDKYLQMAGAYQKTHDMRIVVMVGATGFHFDGQFHGEMEYSGRMVVEGWNSKEEIK